ncbi:MAG: hypothetical protein ACYDCL_00610 [Myxococcales bacterium]
MSPTLANFIFEAANFLLLAAALGWVLFKPVRRALDAERARHAEEAAAGVRLRSEAEALAQQAHAAREAAELEVAERRREAAAAAQQEAARLLEEARKAQALERLAMEAERKSSQAEQADALAETVGRIAAEAVRGLLETLKGPPLDIALVRAACEELAGLPAAAREAALVESARPLGPEARELLARALGRAFDERVVGELGAGVRVTTPAGQVDATAAAIAQRAARTVAGLGAAPVGKEI